MLTDVSNMYVYKLFHFWNKIKCKNKAHELTEYKTEKQN